MSVKPPCRNWIACNYCRYGEKCLFLHNFDTNSVQPNSFKSTEFTDDEFWWNKLQVKGYYQRDEFVKGLEFVRQSEHAARENALSDASLGEDVPADDQAEGQNGSKKLEELSEGTVESISKYKTSYSDRMMLLDKLLEQRYGQLVHDEGSNKSDPTLEVGYIGWKIWTSTYASFVFGDYVDPRVLRPTRSVMDIIVRAMSVLPAVIHFPSSLQKESIAKALTNEFVKANYRQNDSGRQRNENAPVTDTVAALRNKAILIRFTKDMLDLSHKLRKAMIVAASVITSFIGQEDIYSYRQGRYRGIGSATQFQQKHRQELVYVWSGFDQVFHSEDFWKEMMRYRDANEVLSPIIERAEQLTGTTWKMLNQINSCEIRCRRLCQIMPAFITIAVDQPLTEETKTISSVDQPFRLLMDENKAFAALWKIFQWTKGDFDSVFQIACDWLRGGVSRRIGLLVARLSDTDDEVIGSPRNNVLSFNQQQPRNVQDFRQLVRLYILGVFFHHPSNCKQQHSLASSLSRKVPFHDHHQNCCAFRLLRKAIKHDGDCKSRVLLASTFPNEVEFATILVNNVISSEHEV
jgi:hypothetical protein